MAPWEYFSTDIRIVHGRDGSMLAVLIRDFYQDMTSLFAGQDSTHWEISKLAQRWREEGKEECWLEAWLLDDGKWSGPMKIDELLKDHADLLRERFTLPSEQPSFFDLQSDGEWIWVVDNWDVLAIGPKGERLTWCMPVEWKTHSAQANLLFLPGGGVWCIYNAGISRNNEFHVAALSVAGNLIRSEQITDASFRASGSPGQAASSVMVARDKRIWRRSETFPYGHRTYVWSGRQWQEDKELAGPLFEDSDGSLWFLPYTKKAREPYGYRIIKDGKTAILELPPMDRPLMLGGIARSGPDRLFVAANSAVVALVRDGEAPAGWRIDRLYTTKQAIGTAEAFDDGHGNIVGAGWHAKLPAPQPATRPGR